MSTRPLWILPGWSRTFERNRLIYYLLVAAPLSALCATYLGFVWLVLVNFIAFWPFPYRARWTPEGLEVRWFFLRERLRLENILSARLRTDFRRLWLIRYRQVLEIELTVTRRQAILVAPPHILEAFRQEITSALATRGSLTTRGSEGEVQASASCPRT